MANDNVSFENQIRLALRSRTRRLVLRILRERRGAMSNSEICYHTGLSHNQVTGAIHGIPGQYEPSLSLTVIGLVLEENMAISSGRRQKLYLLNRTSSVAEQFLERTLNKYARLGEY